MRFRLSMVLLTVLMLGAGLALSQGEISFNDARVAATFAGAGEPSTARAAIKAGLERHAGALDIAVGDFTDIPLQFVLVRLSSQRPIRLLLNRGGVDSAQEELICDQLQSLFDVRFAEALEHRFAVVGATGVVLSSSDWTAQSLDSAAQTVVEIESTDVAQAFSQQFEQLWHGSSASCTDELELP
ncbi:MAG TPA: phospholipase D-like domain-containing protein [Candidatus Bipolaricaulota bacterium]